jgi:hypothetical protein
MSLSPKRPRTEGTHGAAILRDPTDAAIQEDADFFPPLVAWVTARGGWVHPALAVKERTLRTTTALSPDTLVLRIPVVAAPFEEEETNLAEHALAWYLAQPPASLQPYCASLPTVVDLPRLWPVVWQQLLTGSPVRRDVAATSLRAQYAAACARRASGPAPPSWEDYGRAHALVTSRAFGDDDSGLYMVPILDLCQHCRGSPETKNVSYRRTTAPRGRMQMEVTTSASAIAPHSALRITYGAKPNAVLLVHYGFTLRDNREPDGSSNDVLEWRSTAGPTVLLRTGPPAYTYGAFTTALAAFYEGRPEETVPEEEEEEEQDLKDFLDACDTEEANDVEEEEEEEEKDGAEESDPDLLYNESGPTFTDAIHPQLVRTKQNELDALRKFHQHLQQAADAYTLPKQANWLLLLQEESAAPSRDVYAARLIASELRLLQFYLDTTARLSRRLDPAAFLPTPPRCVPLAPDDARAMDRHIEALIDVYLQLRPLE